MKKQVLGTAAVLTLLFGLVMAPVMPGFCAGTDDDIIVFSEDEATGKTSDTEELTGQSATEKKTETKTDSQAETDTEATDSQKSDKGDFQIDGKDYVLSERYADSEIPAGFSRTKLSIHGGSYDELEGNGMTLVYLKPADNIQGSGVFYVYDKEKDTVSPFIKLGKKNHYCLVQTPKKLINEGLAKKEIEDKNGTKFTAYQFKELANRFYYVYGTDQDGETIWYEYDSETKRVFPANAELLSAYRSTSKSDKKSAGESASGADDSGNKAQADSSNQKSGRLGRLAKNPRALVALLIFIVVVGIIILINAVLFKKGLKEIEEEEGEENREEPVSDADDFMGVDDNLLHADDFEDRPDPEDDDYKNPAQSEVSNMESMAAAFDLGEEEIPSMPQAGETVPVEEAATPLPDEPVEETSDIDDALDHTLSSAMWNSQEGEEPDLDILDLNDL